MVKIGTEIESPQTGERLIFSSTADSSHGQVFRAELIVKPVKDDGMAVGDGHPGETLVCPIGVSHSQWNAGSGTLRIYYEHRPALTSAEIFFETQFGLSRDGKLSPKGEIKLLQGAVLLQEVGDFIRPSSPPIAVQNVLFPVLAALGRWRGYRARYEKYALPTE